SHIGSIALSPRYSLSRTPKRRSYWFPWNKPFACIAEWLHAPAALRLPRQPAQGAHPASLSRTVGPALYSTSTQPKECGAGMREITGIDLTQCPHCGASPLMRLPLAPLLTSAVNQGAP